MTEAVMSTLNDEFDVEDKERRRRKVYKDAERKHYTRKIRAKRKNLHGSLNVVLFGYL